MTVVDELAPTGPLGSTYYEETPGPNGGWIAVTETECSRANNTIRVGNIYVHPTDGYTSQWVGVQLWFRNQWSGGWQYLPASRWVLANATGDPATSAAVFERGTAFATGLLVFAKWDVVVRGMWYFNDGVSRTNDLWIRGFMNQYPGGSHFAHDCVA